MCERSRLGFGVRMYFKVLDSFFYPLQFSKI